VGAAETARRVDAALQHFVRRARHRLGKREQHAIFRNEIGSASRSVEQLFCRDDLCQWDAGQGQ
jgi:hypothetical protein